MDTSFPKQQVETLKSVSMSLYENNQLASDSIKSAIGMPTSTPSQSALGAGDKTASGSQQQVLGMSSLYPQQQQTAQSQTNKSAKPQRVKVPPPSTKVSHIHSSYM